MTTYTADIFFENEVRRFGTGKRRVVVEEGRKWARLEGPNGRVARISVKLLEKLKPVKVEVAASPAAP